METSKQLPKKIKLFKFARKEASLHGDYKISAMPRISEIARNTEDRVKVDLSFYLENDKTPCIKGIINTNIILDCQRCLEAFPIDLKVNFNLAFVRYEDQAEELDSGFEVYVIGEEEDLDSIDLITDEILLSIPMAPSHDFDCSLKIDKEEIVEEIGENPFDVLKNIKMADFGKE
ncbi:YceD family protein [Candidatus Thioglobus sp.]|nr:YceD family protein [Candidatus Thioglobus sp.]